MVMVMLGSCIINSQCGYEVQNEISYNEKSTLPVSHSFLSKNEYILVKKTFTPEHIFESISHHLNEVYVDSMISIQVFNDIETIYYVLSYSLLEEFPMDKFP